MNLKRTISLIGLTYAEKKVLEGIAGTKIRPNAYAMQFLANGAVKFIYNKPTLRDIELSKVTAGNNESIVNTNYKWHKRKVNSKGAIIKKNGGFYKRRQTSVI